MRCNLEGCPFWRHTLVECYFKEPLPWCLETPGSMDATPTFLFQGCMSHDFWILCKPPKAHTAAESTVSFTNSLEGYARNTLVVHTLSQPLMLICPNSLSRAGPQNGAGAPIPTGFALAAPFGFCFGFVFSSVGGSPVLALSQLWEFCPAQPKSNLARCFCCELVCFWNLK